MGKKDKAKKAHTMQEGQAAPPSAHNAVDKIKRKTVAVRINEADYNRLNSLFTAQGTSITAAGRAALFYLAEQIEAGHLSIPNGAIYRHQSE